MGFNDKSQLVDRRGQPFSARIQAVLQSAAPRFRRRFPGIRDEAVIADILEQAGQLIVDWERDHGQAGRLHGFAWVTLNNLGISKLRESSHRVEQSSIGSTEGDILLSRLQTDRDGPKTMENNVLVKQALDLLTDLERKVVLRKRAGYSSEEIARFLNSTTAAIDQTYFRAKHKIRKFFQTSPEGE